jgi:hypothetical protein
LRSAISGRETEVNMVREQLVRIAAAGGSEKLRVLGELANLGGEDDAITRICNARVDPTVTWHCAEKQRARIDSYLHAISLLPVLSYADAARLDSLARDSKKLPGLHCLHKASWSASPAATVARRPRNTRLPEEVVIYYRLHHGAPSPIKACLAEEAARACLDLIQNAEVCPLPSSVADYVALLDASQRDEVLGSFTRKGASMLSDERRGMNPVLLHLHIALAEILGDEAFHWKRPPRDVLWLATQHVLRALFIWQEAEQKDNERIDFPNLLSPSLKQQICDNVICPRVCAKAWRTCRNECDLPQVKAALCSNPRDLGPKR